MGHSWFVNQKILNRCVHSIKMSFSVKRLPRRRGLLLISGLRAVNEESISESHPLTLPTCLQVPHHFQVARLRKTCQAGLNRLGGDNGEVCVISHLVMGDITTGHLLENGFGA